MVLFNNTDREMSLKLVYVGCALSGKTTTLEQIHKAIQNNQRSRLFSLNTANDRTLFFDLLPLDLGHISGYSVKLQLFTVPGQVQYGSTRRAVLSGVDAIVLVVDSADDRLSENRLALRELAEHLDSHDLNIRQIPLVLQYNKRDLPNVLPVDTLDQALNKNQWARYDSVATMGKGVFEPFLEATKMMAGSITERYRFVSSFPERLVSSLQTLLPGAHQEAKAETGSSSELLLSRKEILEQAKPKDLDSQLVDRQEERTPFLKQPPVVANPPAAEKAPVTRHRFRASIDSNQALESQHLVEGAVEANVAMAEVNSKLDRTRRELRSRVGQLANLARLARLISVKPNLPDLLQSNFTVILKSLRAAGGSVLMPTGNGPKLKAVVHEGFATDPLNSIPCKDFPSVAAGLCQRGRSSTGPGPEGKISPIDKQLEHWGIVSHISQPLVAKGRQFGIVSIYRIEPSPPFDKADMAFFSAMVALTSLALHGTR